MKKLQYTLTSLVTILGIYILWMSFGFNFRVIRPDGTQGQIKMYLELGGLNHIIIISILAIIMLTLFIIYAILHSSKTEMYNDGHEITFHKRNNLFTLTRAIQLFIIVMLVVNLSTIIYRVSTSSELEYYSILFRRDILIFGFEFTGIYLLLLAGSLLIEISNDKDIVYF